jgi:5-methylcytosine-specific restriction endonuclease McrA
MAARPILAFTSSGVLVGKFGSVSDGIESTGVSRHIINRILGGSYNVDTDDFFWIDEDAYKAIDAKNHHKRDRAYFQYNITPKLRKKGQLKCVFLSIAAASRVTGLSVQQIRNIPLNGCLKTDEFIMETKEVVESIRDLIDSKFRDDPVDDEDLRILLDSMDLKPRCDPVVNSIRDLIDSKFRDDPEVDDACEDSSDSEPKVVPVTNESVPLGTPLRSDNTMPILQYEVDPLTRQKGRLIGGFLTIKEASKTTGLSCVVISRCLKGKNFQRDDFIWERRLESVPSSPQGNQPILSVEDASERTKNQISPASAKKQKPVEAQIDDEVKIDHGHVKNQFLKVLSSLESKIRRYDSGIDKDYGAENDRTQVHEFQTLDVQLLDLTRHLDEAGDKSIQEVYRALVSKVHENIIRIVREIEDRLASKSTQLPQPKVNIETVRRSPRKAVSKDFRVQVWAKYIGMKYGEIKCPLCQVIDIKQLDFVCGHVQAHVEGGELTIENIRPICSVCNSSMGKKLFDLTKYKVILPKIGE